MTGKQTLKDRTAFAQGTGRTRKWLIYTLGALVLLSMAFYFYQQFRGMLSSRGVAVVPPPRSEKLDTTGMRPKALTRVYEQEEKNRYRDSVAVQEEEKALDYLVMDWENLYDLRRRKLREQSPTQQGQPDTLSALLRAFRPDSIRVAKRHPIASVKAKRTVRSRTAKANRRGTVPNPSRERSPFNTLYGITASAASPGAVLSAASDPAAQSVEHYVPALVHGEHKVQTGSKVTLRLQEDAFVKGIPLPRNTLIVGIAQFNNGRITITGLRARFENRSLLLPYACYDSDLMAGIPYGDQGMVETELRRTSSTALANAAGELSSAIPYGELARATGGIARSFIRGDSRSREQFIYLSDGYPVFLAPLNHNAL